MNLDKYIQSLNLALEERHRGNCPKCEGKNTFTVTRAYDRILYNCYKAGCTLAGTHITNVTVSDFKRQKNRDTSKAKFILPDYLLPHRQESIEWANNYGLSSEDLNLLYDVKEHRVVFPVLHDSKIVDATGRGIRTNQKPKWKRYGTSSYGYTCGEGKSAVVVEDCISAATVATISYDATGFALMGTSLLPEHIIQLKKYSKVIVALDPDAVQKTFAFTRQLRGVMDSCVHALNIHDDLKYRITDDIINLKLLLSR